MSLDLDQTRWLLSHMYDNAALAAGPMPEDLGRLGGDSPQSVVQGVRSLLLDAIEFLRPARQDSPRSDAARSHSVLWMRYVEGMSIAEVGEELALSERQTHRELRLAEAKVQDFVSRRLESLTAAGAAGIAVEVQPAPVAVDVAEALADAVRTVQPLADRLGVAVHITGKCVRGRAFLDGGILRHLLTQAISIGVQGAQGSLAARLLERNGACRVEIDLGAAADRGSGAEMIGALERLAAAAGVAFHRGDRCLAMEAPLRQPRDVLVVEDNAAAVELCRRYLEADGQWRVVAVADPRLAYDAARELQPALVILDLLMPGTDGWSILNLMHAHEATAGIPVIVCSVFQDPLLAEALGAKAQLRKPFSQAQLLDAVRTWAR